VAHGIVEAKLVRPLDDVVVLVCILCVSQAQNLGLLWELPGGFCGCQ
jgi:hypothetical protein